MGLENGDGGRPPGNGEWLWDVGREAGRRQLRSWLRDSPGAEQRALTPVSQAVTLAVTERRPVPSTRPGSRTVHRREGC